MARRKARPRVDSAVESPSRVFPRPLDPGGVPPPPEARRVPEDPWPQPAAEPPAAPPAAPRRRGRAGGEGPGAPAVPPPPMVVRPVGPDRAPLVPFPRLIPRELSGDYLDRARGLGDPDLGRIGVRSAGPETFRGLLESIVRPFTRRGILYPPEPGESVPPPPVDGDLPSNYREQEPGQGWGLYVPPVRTMGELPRVFEPRPPDRRGVVDRAVDWLNPLAPVPGRVRLPSGVVVPYDPAMPAGSPRWVDRAAGTPPSESLDELRVRQYGVLRDRLEPFAGLRPPGDPPRLIRPGGSSPPMLPDELTLQQFESLRRRVMIEADERRGIGSRREGPASPAADPRPPDVGGPPDMGSDVPEGPGGDPNGPEAWFPGLDGPASVATELEELRLRVEALGRGPRDGYDLAGALPGSGSVYRMG